MSYLLKGALLGLSLSFTACTGQFQVVRLNNAPEYNVVESQENLRKITIAHLNATDLRGNTANIFEYISKEEALAHAKWLADFFVKEKVDIITLNEVDYAGTAKTGGLDQPKIIAEFMGPPYNYVMFDQYLKSPLWTTGNAMISRFPMRTIYRHLYEGDLDSRLGQMFKDFIHGEIKVGKRELEVITLHFDDEKGLYDFRRKEQAQELHQYVMNYHHQHPNSFIVVPGDYNDAHDSQIMRTILAGGVLHPPAENFGLKTYQNGNLYTDIDHVLATRNIAINDYHTFNFPWSDHLGVLCELEFLE